MKPVPFSTTNSARPAARRLQTLLEAARTGRRTLIMGVLNVTPDSFSDGGRFFVPDEALAHAERMVAEGADILDIGGESTRPATFATGTPLDVDEELRRILPIIHAIAARMPEVPISVDTYKAAVARQAVEAGAAMINDISAMRADPEMAVTVAEFGTPVCLMHMPGLPTALPIKPAYQDVVREVREHLMERAAAARAAGIAPENIVLDPGIGFGKTVAHNLELLRRLRELTSLYPLLLGASRKSTIGKVLGDLPPEDRLEGTAATVALSIANGAAIVRVHDVKEMARVARMSDAIVRGWPPPGNTS
ncbi:MAG: Dihydropteroate synthase [Chthonomonadaceae bacterium]|nr:Dihydropteroate synthase [Chthonomonadaceae bacterium]